jgi:DNA polymerase-3 subunit alpha
MHVLPQALQAAGEIQQDRRFGQTNFLDVFAGANGDSAPVAASLPDIPEWSDSEKLKNEKEALDFYFSSHPLAQHEKELRRYASHTIESLASLGPNQEVLIGGMLTQVRFQNTKKARNGNSRYVRCRLEDFTGSTECVMWPDDFVRYKDEFKEDRICLVKATVERTREEPGLILTRVLSLEQAKLELTRWLRLTLNAEMHGAGEIQRMAGILQRAPGPCPVFLEIRDATGKRCRLKASEQFRVNPSTLCTSELEMLLGPERVEFYGQANGNGRNGK